VSNFQMPVELYMSSPVHTVRPDDDLREAQRRLDGLSISSLAVVEGDGDLVGVISMTDLIRVGRRQAGSRGKAALLTLPEMPISRRMSTEVVKLGPQDSIAIAAKKMVRGRLHRVFVEESGRLTGVFSTKDLMLAIHDKRVKSPISEWMSSPIFTIRSEEPVSLAAERLEKARVTGLVVVEDDWPVGLHAAASRRGAGGGDEGPAGHRRTRQTHGGNPHRDRLRARCGDVTRTVRRAPTASRLSK